jgi:hypothetical protein
MPAEAGENPAAEELLAQMASAGCPFYCDDLFTQPDRKLYFRPYSMKWDQVGHNPVEAVADVDYPSGYLLWLRDEAALKELTPHDSPASPPAATLAQRLVRLFVPAAPPPAPAGWSLLRLMVPGKVVVWIDDDGQASLPTPKRIRELLAAGTILRAWGYQVSLEPERFGVFGYQLNTFDNWIAGPFERGTEPPQPLRYDELPAAAKNMLQLCSLPAADFRHDALLQPFEHGPAHCWGEHWISTTGRQFRSEQHGPELPGLRSLLSSGAIATPGAGGSTMRALAAAYLNGEAGVVDVFNDFLEEAGQPRIAAHDTPDQRLDELLLKLFPPTARHAAEAAFVEHALAHSPPPAEAAAAAQSAIAAVREWLAGQKTEEQLDLAAREVMAAWMPADENLDEDGAPLRDNGVAWAAWALTRRWPLAAARTVRTVQSGELAWQAEHVVQQLADTRPQVR